MRMNQMNHWKSNANADVNTNTSVFQIMGLFGVALAVLLLLGAMQPSHAASGWGCFRVINVSEGDMLNLRAQPTARSAVVDKLGPNYQHGIIAENGACLPANQPPSKQWCPLRHINGDQDTEGWARLRYLAANECP